MAFFFPSIINPNHLPESNICGILALPHRVAPRSFPLVSFQWQFQALAMDLDSNLNRQSRNSMPPTSKYRSLAARYQGHRIPQTDPTHVSIAIAQNPTALSLTVLGLQRSAEEHHQRYEKDHAQKMLFRNAYISSNAVDVGLTRLIISLSKHTTNSSSRWHPVQSPQRHRSQRLSPTLSS